MSEEEGGLENIEKLLTEALEVYSNPASTEDNKTLAQVKLIIYHERVKEILKKNKELTDFKTTKYQEEILLINNSQKIKEIYYAIYILSEMFKNNKTSFTNEEIKKIRQNTKEECDTERKRRSVDNIITDIITKLYNKITQIPLENVMEKMSLQNAMQLSLEEENRELKKENEHFKLELQNADKNRERADDLEQKNKILQAEMDKLKKEYQEKIDDALQNQELAKAENERIKNTLSERNSELETLTQQNKALQKQLEERKEAEREKEEERKKAEREKEEIERKKEAERKEIEELSPRWQLKKQLAHFKFEREEDGNVVLSCSGQDSKLVRIDSQEYRSQEEGSLWWKKQVIRIPMQDIKDVVNNDKNAKEKNKNYGEFMRNFFHNYESSPYEGISQKPSNKQIIPEPRSHD